MSPVCAVPPVPDFNVVIVSASGAVPDIVMTSPTLLIARARALDPAGTAAGGPTAILTSSSPVTNVPAAPPFDLVIVSTDEYVIVESPFPSTP